MKRIIYVSQADIMERTGRGVREREMVVRLLADKTVEGIFIGEKPHTTSPIDNVENAYLIPLRKTPLGYVRFQLILFKILWKLTCKKTIRKKTVMFVRQAPLMVAPYYISKYRHIPLMLRGAGGGNVYGYYKGKGVSSLMRKVITYFGKCHTLHATRVQMVASQCIVNTKRLYPKLDTNKCDVLPCGCNPDIFYIMDVPSLPKELSYLQNNRIICFVGAINPQLGIEDMIQSLGIICKSEEYADVRLVIIGGANYMGEGFVLEQLKKNIKHLNIEDKVIFTGEQSQDFINKVLNSCKAAVVPWGKHVWYEIGASPTKLYEYLAAGAYSIITRHEDVEFIEKYNLGALCNQDDPEDMAKTIKKALNTPNSMEAKLRRREYVIQHHSADILYQKMRDWILSAAK